MRLASLNSFTTQSQVVTILWKEFFENIVGKGENAGNQHFLLFQQCFLLYQREKLACVKKKMSSANAFNVVRAKILLFGKGFQGSLMHLKK